MIGKSCNWSLEPPKIYVTFSQKVKQLKMHCLFQTRSSDIAMVETYTLAKTNGVVSRSGRFRHASRRPCFRCVARTESSLPYYATHTCVAKCLLRSTAIPVGLFCWCLAVSGENQSHRRNWHTLRGVYYTQYKCHTNRDIMIGH